MMNNESKKDNGGGGNARRGEIGQRGYVASAFARMHDQDLASAVVGDVSMSSDAPVSIDLDSRTMSQWQQIPPTSMGWGGKMPAAMTAGGVVNKSNPTPASAASAPAAEQQTNSRASANSSNGGASVKFAMPAAVACVEPDSMAYKSPGTSVVAMVSNSSRIGSQSNDGGNDPQGAGSGASSGSLSTEGNNATGSLLSLCSAESRDGERKSSVSGGSGNLKHESKPPSSETSNTNSGDDDVKPTPTMNLNLKKNSSSRSNSRSGSSGAGSGSDNNGGATSSSGNAAAVTASTSNNNTTSSGGSGDDRSSSGSGGGSGSGGNRRSGGEASSEYYYAGYGSGPSTGGTSSNQAASDGAPQGPALQAAGVGMANSNLPTFASFQGAPLAAASAAAAAGPQAQQPRQPGLAPPHNNAANMAARHIVVASAEGGLPPPSHAFSSHLRHHSRHYHAHRGRRGDVAGALEAAGDTAEHGATRALPQAPPANAAVAPRPVLGAAFPNGIPSAISGPAISPLARQPSQQAQAQRYRGTNNAVRAHAHQRSVSNHYELRLPPSDEQAVLQRVPRTHATVVAHDLPPPPTSSDAWSSAASGSGSNSRSRERTAAKANNPGTYDSVAGQPMVASVRLSNGGTVDSINMNDGSLSSSSDGEQQNTKPQATAMHVTTEDPILRKKISLKHEQAPSKQLESEPSAEAADAPPRCPSVKPLNAGTSKNAISNAPSHKRNISAMTRATASDDSASDGAGETEAVGSGSDEGYAASSERQSGSGSDSISSDDANKKDKAVTRVAQSKSKAGAMVASQSNSKRTETSSMSSSPLADFSSAMEVEGSIPINSLSRSESPKSSCTSLSSKGCEDGNEATGVAKIKTKTKQDTAKGRKRAPSINASSNKAPKRSKAEAGDAKPSADSDGLKRPHNTMKSGLSIMERSLQQKFHSSHHHQHHYHSRSMGRKMLEKSFLSAKHDLSTANEDAASAMQQRTTSPFAKDGVEFHEGKSTGCDHPLVTAVLCQDASVYYLGQDVMARVVAFLDPPETHSFLTAPLSKTWLVTYTASQELWKILCSSQPFFAKLDESVCSDASNGSFPICNDLEMRHLFGRCRLLYTSFIRCMKYLRRLQDDALNDRTPTVYTSSNQNENFPFNKNTSLKAYFAKARTLARSSRLNGGSGSSSDAALSITSNSGSHGSGDEKKRRTAAASVRSEAVASTKNTQNNASRPRFGRSMLTDRLLRPTQAGDVDNVNLPWSCAIYSVVNWMVAFADVEGIQIMCLRCLPYLLEDESQRTTAQRAGLTDSVLRAMVLFPDSIELHTVAFHTLVLLARPVGGNEGMLFHTAMVNIRGIFNSGSSGNSKNGIVIMLDSMRRFAQDEILQAMSCWSLVNVALTPLQKSMLVKLGGLTVTSNAMLQHPYNAEVQFRALFALINLVIPTETRPGEAEQMREIEREIFQQLGEAGETSEKEMLDASVGQIANLVVVAMKNFCSSEAILNRACLVLHNLSLNEGYHSILLWTPNCYQMLEWCLGNYPHDHVLQQSAGGTIQRLNATLSADDDLRARFTHSIRAQQQHSLELARQEAVFLQEQQREQEELQRQINAS